MRRSLKNYMKKYILLVAVLSIALVPARISYAQAAAYSDLNGSWASAYVDVLVQKGVISGYPDGKLYPDSYMTLAEYIRTIMAAVSDEGKTLSASGGHWADSCMDEALKDGLVDDAAYNDRTAWDKPLNRLEMARIAHTTLLNILNESDESDAASVAHPLTDIDSCNACRPHIEQLFAKGIILGRPGHTFAGDDFMTRAEGFTITARVIDKALRAVPERAEATGYTTISGADAKAMRENDPRTVIIDVRRPDERKTGYVGGSLNLIYGVAAEEDFERAVPDKTTPVIVYCASGVRSAKTAALLVSWGYTGVYDMGKVSDYPDPLVVDDK